MAELLLTHGDLSALSTALRGHLRPKNVPMRVWRVVTRLPIAVEDVPFVGRNPLYPDEFRLSMRDLWDVAKLEPRVLDVLHLPGGARRPRYD